MKTSFAGFSHSVIILRLDHLTLAAPSAANSPVGSDHFNPPTPSAELVCCTVTVYAGKKDP